MKFFKGFLPLILVISLLSGCSAVNKSSNLVPDIKQNGDIQAQRRDTPKITNTTEEKTPQQGDQTPDKSNTSPPAVISNKRPEIPDNYPYEYLEAVEDEIVRLCNQERAKAGLKPLEVNETLRLSARYKSNEMLQYNYFEHESPITYFNPWDIAKTFGYKYKAFGENIYMSEGIIKGEIDAANIVDAWMKSPGHRENILSEKYGRIGVGVVFSTENNRCEATQHFSN